VVYGQPFGDLPPIDPGYMLESASFHTNSDKITLTFRISGGGTATTGLSFDDFSVVLLEAVPEPSTWVLVVSSLGVLSFFRKWRAKRRSV